MRIRDALLLVCLFAPTQLQAQRSPRVDSYVLTLGERLPDTAERRAVDGPQPGDSSRYLSPEPTLDIMTSEPYSCLLQLGMQTQRQRERVVLEILGPPTAPTVCPMMVGPARTSVALPSEPGTYELRVQEHGRKDQYVLRVTDSLIQVRPQAGRFTRFTKLTRWRAPQLTFAFYCTLPWTSAGLDTSQSWVCREAEQILRDSLPITPVVLSPDQEEPFLPAHAQQWGPVRYFRYDTAGVFRRAYDLLQGFSRARLASAAPNASISVMNWRHLGFNTYLCRKGQGWCEASMGYPFW